MSSGVGTEVGGAPVRNKVGVVGPSGTGESTWERRTLREGGRTGTVDVRRRAGEQEAGAPGPDESRVRRSLGEPSQPGVRTTTKAQVKISRLLRPVLSQRSGSVRKNFRIVSRSRRTKRVDTYVSRSKVFRGEGRTDSRGRFVVGPPGPPTPQSPCSPLTPEKPQTFYT